MAKWLVLAFLGLFLTVTVIPGVFIIDDVNYLINVVELRRGHVTVANTAGLSPSRELAWFDPGTRSRPILSTPVASTAPPLYAPIAVPFSFLGWRGLVALNTLAYLATVAMVFAYTRRYALHTWTPWLAAGAFAAGGFAIEYAQGLWPHALSLALCIAAIIAIDRLFERDRAALAALAGFLLAAATGVRYQNAVILGACAGALVLWSRSRWRMLAAYAVGAALPLMVSASINYARLGFWNPISKAPGYLKVPILQVPASSVFDPLVMFWARIVDFTFRPPLVGPSFVWVRYDVETGAHLMMGSVAQKAFLQSAPWAVLALLLFVLAWSSRFQIPDGQRRPLRLLSLVAAAVIGTFAFSGIYRHEGLAFNQRYLLELLPIAAVGFAWSLDGLAVRKQPLFAGILWGMLPAAFVLYGMSPGTLRILALLKFPVLAALVLAVLWFVARARLGVRPWLTVVAGIALGWGLVLHVGQDVAASRALRQWNRELADGLRRGLPDHAALVTYWGAKDAVGPLLLERDLVVLDAHGDDGQDAPKLIDELLSRGRRVFVLRPGFPQDVYKHVVAGRTLVPRPGTGMVELRGATIQ